MNSRRDFLSRLAVGASAALFLPKLIVPVWKPTVKPWMTRVITSGPLQFDHPLPEFKVGTYFDRISGTLYRLQGGGAWMATGFGHPDGVLKAVSWHKID